MCDEDGTGVFFLCLYVGGAGGGRGEKRAAYGRKTRVCFLTRAARGGAADGEKRISPARSDADKRIEL